MAHTPQQIKAKIQNLDRWLTANPEHPNHSTIVNDRRKLKETLKNK